MTCTYKFVGTNGKETIITGQAAFKAFLAEGGLEQLLGKAAPQFSTRQSGNATMGINVNQDGGNAYADKIIDGEKTIETRASDSLRPYVGKRIAIVRTGAGPAKAIGEVTLGEPIVVKTQKEFDEYRNETLVPKGSKFDIKTGGVKYLYPVSNPTRYEKEKDVGTGIVARKIIEPKFRDAADTNSPFTVAFSTRQQAPNTWPNIEEPDGSEAKPGEPITVLRLASMEGLDNVNAASLKGLYSYLSMIDDNETGAGSEAAESDTIYAYKVTVPADGFGDYRLMGKGKTKTGEAAAEAGRQKAKYGGYWYSFPQGTEAELLGSIPLADARKAAAKAERAAADKAPWRKSPVTDEEAAKLKGNFDFIGTDAGTEALRQALGLSFSKRQTNTPEFKRFFKDSKVVDKNGEPLVVYHGTNKSFNVFRPSKKFGNAYFASASTSYANTLAKDVFGKTGGDNVMPLYVSLQNPRIIDFEDYNDAALESAMTDGNADGLIAVDKDGVMQVVVAFKPTQIKSATGNVGTFDATNPDIRFSKQQEVPKLTPEDVLQPDTIAAAKDAITKYKKAEEPDPLTAEERALGEGLLQPVFEAAKNNKPGFDAVLDKVAEKVGGYAKKPGIKKMQRAVTKLATEQGWDVETMKDLLRGTIVVSTFEKAQEAIDEIGKVYTFDRIKNRLSADMVDPDGKTLPGKPLPTGYQDILTNVVLEDGTVAEIQISTPEMIAAKNLGHEVYAFEREMPNSPVKTRMVDLQKKIYSEGLEAYKRRASARALTRASVLNFSKTSSNSAASIGSPFSRTSEGLRGLGSGTQAVAERQSGATVTGTSATSKNIVPGGKALKSNFIETSKQSITENELPSKSGPQLSRRQRIIGPRNAVSFSNRNIFNQPAPLANWTAPLQTKADTLIYALQNKLIDTKRVIEAINQTGKQIDEDWNVYLQEELFHGRTAKQTTDFLQTELRPLVEDMQKRGVDLSDFEEYLHNRHAEERNKQIAKVNPNMPDGGSGIDTADAQAYLAGLTADQKRDYSALAARIDAINQNTRDLLVNSGLESQETIDKWEKTYSDYVPLFRDDVDFSTQGPAGMRTGQGYSVKGGASRRAMGSKKAVIDILANIAMQRERTIVRAEKNRVALSLYGLAVQNPNTDFWLAIDPAGQKNPNRAMADLMTIGVNPVDAQNIIKEPKQRYVDQNTGLVAERINPAIRSNPMVLAARIDGVEKYVFFNANDERSQRMVSALKNLDADQLGYVTANFIAPVTRWFAQVNTQFNPIFGAINFIRDSKGAMFNLSTTAIAGKQADVAKGLFPAMKGIYQGSRAQRKGGPPATGSYARLWDEFQQVGGQTGYRDQFINSEDRAKALQRMLDPASWASSPLGKVFTANGTLKVPMEVARKTAAPLFDWLSDYNETMENAVRLSAYKVALDNGLSKQEAASIAKNLTVNFNRKGQIATQAGAWYAFFNASIQSNARYIETLRGPLGKKIIAGGLMIGTAQALLLAAAGFDDDEPPDFIKERNLVIPIGTSRKYITIPMPLGFNVIPNTSRVMTEWVLFGFKDTPKRVGQITGALLETFNPIGNSGWSVQTIAPTIADPIVALAENRDFTGKNIAKKDRSELAPTPGYTRTKDSASFIAKQMSYFLNLASGGTDFKPGLFSPTPDQIDYLIGQATGGVGREVLKIEQSVTGVIKKEEVAPNKIPIVGRFYGDANATANISGKYYDNLTMLNKHEAEIEGRKKRGEKLDEYYKDNPEARLYKKANDVESDVARLRKRLKALKERKASDETIKLVNTQITAKMKRLNTMVKDAEE